MAPLAFRRVDKLPPAFKRFRRIGGVVEFAVFEEAGGSEDETLAAIGSVLAPDGRFDEAGLRALGYRRIRERRFFGDWLDPDSGALIRVGDWETTGGERLHNPKLKSIGRNAIASGTFSPPNPGSGGQFAYAFTTPPYPLRARPGEVQELFDEIREFILPAKLEATIWDWSSPRLPDVSPLFAPGMEWWGVFLFSIHVADLRRLTIVFASTTD